MTAADVLVETLLDWGVEVIFGLPGDGINGIVESLRTHEEKIRFIQVRHEEAAAFMACGYAKFTGKLGVCLATSGPGGIHLLNGLYDAKLDTQPVLAITGLQFHDLIGTFTQQDVALDKLYMDVAVFNERIMGPTHVENITELACRTALAYHGVAHITFPVDLQEKEVKKKQASSRNIPHHTSDVSARSARLPNHVDLERAADILNRGKKVAILAGRGALNATDELEQTAELLAAPIVKPLLGKAAVPDDSPYTTGGIGLLGTKPSQEALEDCDTLLMVGTSFPYIEFMPKPGQAKGVQIELDPKRIGLRYPVEVGLVGDSRDTLRELIPLLKRKEDRKFLQAAQAGMKDWWELMEKRATRRDMPMKPQVVAWELGKRLRNDAIVSCDSGTIATWWARHILARRGQMHTLSGNLATMAPGLPYTIAAQIAFPNRQCVGFVGDGGFSMLMADFVTAVKYKLPIKVVIIKNNTLGQIKWEQMVFLGNPEYCVDLQPIDFAAFAHACGGLGFSVEDPADCGRAMDEFLAAPGPAILQAAVDPFEPPMPAKVKADQALHFAESLARGEPNRKKIALTTLSDQVRELI
ncbi:MAG TPA: thiamine pyrophosphate-dependent enzyme [Candidatus Sulfotelmatobacter sp.]|jgi:pyruvate dehydrogenase (quinone)/pyruvate oxidase|nr:thiamine pyrophosphate-dependent enzyme [Candidatus Sulfotelmatobacter sp.]